MSMAEPEFALFQMQFEGLFGDAIELRPAAFGKAPKRLNAIDMLLTSNKFVVAVIDPKVLVKADVYQPIVATPTIGMDDAGDVYLAPNNGLQCGFGGIGDDLQSPRLSKPKTIVLPNARRPRLPRTRSAPKYDSSASIVPVSGEHSAHQALIRLRMRR